jgi:phage host-nuclease inhibitor protein Gam
MAKKNKATTIKSREELESVFGEYSAKVLERDRLTVEMEMKIAEIRSGYEAPIAACVEVGDGLFDDMQAWAALHPEEFAARRSIDLLHGRLGFRTGNPAVRQAPGVKAEHSLELLKASAPQWTRTKSEIDKEQILCDLASGADVETALRPFGLRIDKAETFYCDIKREE